MKVLILLLFFVLAACSNDSTRPSEEANPPIALFSPVSAETSGVSFVNRIHETAALNGILYEYLYNGGGVAAGDLNGDLLPDLYFVSNLESNRFYLNKGKLKFEEETIPAGLQGQKVGFSTGVTLVDINADGKLDIYLCKSGKYNNPDHRRNELYINTGNDDRGVPRFKEMASEYGLDLPHYSTQAAFFDYDKDGDLDLFLINHGIRSYEDKDLLLLMDSKNPMQAEQLYRNDGDRFTNVSEQAGIINNSISYGLGIAIGDLDNDTWPDIIVGQDYSEKDHIYLNQHDGTFKEVIEQSTGHCSFYSMGNDIADFNNDGWLDYASLDMAGENSYDIKTSMSGMDPGQFDLLTGNGLHFQYMYNSLQVNNGTVNGIPRFSDIAQLAGVASTDWSWGPLFFDADNDGLKDLFISNGIKRDFRNNDFLTYKQGTFDEFFKNHPDRTPEDKIKARALTNELTRKMPVRKKNNHLYRNLDGYKFSETQWIPFKATCSNGAVYSDLDLDGDLDLVLNNMDDEAGIYENHSDERNGANFIQVKLKGPAQNPFGIGTRVIVSVEGRDQVIENYASRGFQSASLGNLHFGLGGHSKVQQVSINWPGGEREVIPGLEANKVYTFDHKKATPAPTTLQEAQQALFQDITHASNLAHRHVENEFDDFSRESLLPHRMSRFGPALAVGDINGDHLDDIYAGGAFGQKGTLYLQLPGGTFKPQEANTFVGDEQFEDVGAVFFDMDKDGDQDLYVVSGGNEVQAGSPQLDDRLYENRDGLLYKLSASPLKGVSGSVVVPADYDNDGDLDLFVGGRQVPGAYPSPADSYLLQNNRDEKGARFVMAQTFGACGMITSAHWADIDGDGWIDLIIAGEWTYPVMYKNNKGFFEDQGSVTGLTDETGWWFGIAGSDFDADGDIDFVLGNNGLNYKYKASKDEPFELYMSDFDENNTLDIVLGYFDEGKRVPVRGRECTSNQMPFVKSKFRDYHSFASASLEEIYGENKLKESLQLKATNFSTSYLENLGNWQFKITHLPVETQLSAIHSLLAHDVDKDGNMDLVLAGNFYVSEVETPRNDASYGVMLKGMGDGSFRAIKRASSGLFVPGDVRDGKRVRLPGNREAIVFVKNDDWMQLIEIVDPGSPKIPSNKKNEL